MSEENVEMVRRVYGLWENEIFNLDEELFTELLHPDIEWDVTRRTFDPGIYRGHEGVREFVAALQEVWASGQITPLEFVPLGCHVVVPVRLSLTSRTDRQTITANAAHLWTLGDGKVTRHCVFQSKAGALEAAGPQG